MTPRRRAERIAAEQLTGEPLIVAIEQAIVEALHFRPMGFIAAKEFREAGYLQEVNRRHLHPLGLALVTEIEDDGRERLLGLADVRADPEGMMFADGVIDPAKAQNITLLEEKRRKARESALGWFVQPLPR